MLCFGYKCTLGVCVCVVVCSSSSGLVTWWPQVFLVMCSKSTQPMTVVDIALPRSGTCSRFPKKGIILVCVMAGLVISKELLGGLLGLVVARSSLVLTAFIKQNLWGL